MNLFVLFTLLGFNQRPVNDLRKKRGREDYQRDLNQWIGKNFYIICLAAIIFMLILLVIVCFQICGVSAVESGMMRNFMVRSV